MAICITFWMKYIFYWELIKIFIHIWSMIINHLSPSFSARSDSCSITFSVRLQGQLELFKTWIFDLNWPYWFIRIIKYTHECHIKLQFQFFSERFEINFFISKKSLSFWNWGFQSTNIRIFWVENANCQCSDNDRVLCLI